MKTGKVFLVGAGPGDVGLITVKGMEAIQQADVILYDRLANPKLLKFAPANCELIYCGKLPDRHVLRQEAINSLLVEKGLQGKIVVRLKGGDPGVFGRVGEEAAALAEHNIPYEMVPGITSGIAAPLYAGIPVTHREFGESFAIVTAHDKSREGQPNLNWAGLATSIDTIAFYMGISNLPYIAENLIKHGKPSNTPVILIRWGTFGRQQTLEGTLSTIAEKAKAEKFANPAITLVGDIVSVREKLNWFEKKPLFGRQILLPRTGTDESRMAKELSDHGADVIEFPRWIRTVAPINHELLDKISSYEKILFTSPESVNDFFEVLLNQGIDVRSMKANLYGLSSKSIRAIQAKGLLAELMDEMDVKEEVVKFLVVGDEHQESTFGKTDFYRTSSKEIDKSFLPILARMLEESDINTILLPSSSAVHVLMTEGINDELISNELLEKAEVVCLGEKTEAALRKYGYQADLLPDSPTIESVLKCLKK
ncbi:uroporphyrinogen-III C-methyltransferase [Mesobacillus persicus]|uniref:Uroporphyrinogen-III C-methyltransferase n=1 Tax=Mesobacillus persicus TaxID=930146 RepID=A0A1H8K1N4_9BACI|nr:uroporphyrinogen-III C-methyltransferase [Mesobacillus persicus]SEN86883.1 uroporphyrinogen-III C-methyltransferase [Mesobacillus persicus]